MMSNQRGFSLIEMGIATACALLLVLGASTLATQAIRHHQRAVGKIDTIQQNNEIKDLMFNLAGASSGSCKDRLGITSSSPAFTPGADYQLPLGNLPSAGAGVSVERLYLATDTSSAGAGTLIQTAGGNKVYSAQLRIEQKLVRDVAGGALMPVTLGVMNVTVDSSNRIVGCNWDETTVTPMQVCTGSTGTVATSAGCFMAPEIPIIATCPTGTSMAQGLCIPSNVDCYNRYLGNNFDGYKFGCGNIPPTHVVRYPSGYTPGEAPTQTSTGTGTSTGSDTGNTAPTCACGNYQIAAGGSQLCIRGWSDDEYFGNYDDMWQIRRCNSAGQLEANSPNEYVFEEEGDGVEFSWRPGSCMFSSGSKNVDGRRYTLGRCQ